MKNGIFYGGPFLFAFIIVTGAIIYMNSTYENIFAFNFNPKTDTEVSSDSSKTKEPKKNEIKNPDKNKDLKKPPVNTSSLNIEEPVENNTLAEDNVMKQDQNLTTEVKDTTKPDLIAEKNDFVETSDNSTSIEDSLKQKEAYSTWIKKVTSIYESLDPGKAAKIIQTYSDNVARDILYNMRKKSAAKIVAELSPETTNRIFRFE